MLHHVFSSAANDQVFSLLISLGMLAKAAVVTVVFLVGSGFSSLLCAVLKAHRSSNVITQLVIQVLHEM